MATYAVGGTQSTMSSSYKGHVALIAPSSAPRRLKIYEYKIGATGNPNATDTYFQFDISRLSQTTSLAGTSFTPNPTDGADSASVTLANINQTTEPSAALIANSLDNFGINQRSTVRWVVSQESQALIGPATSANGLYIRCLSNAFTGANAVQVSFME
jgi:hypothetical protein